MHEAASHLGIAARKCWLRGMAALFDRLEEEHVAFIVRQRMFFVATATDDAHPNLSPKGYDTLRVLGATPRSTGTPIWQSGRAPSRP